MLVLIHPIQKMRGYMLTLVFTHSTPTHFISKAQIPVYARTLANIRLWYKSFQHRLCFDTIKSCEVSIRQKQSVKQTPPIIFSYLAFYKQRYSAKLKFFFLFQNKYYIFLQNIRKNSSKSPSFCPKTIQKFKKSIKLLTLSPMWQRLSTLVTRVIHPCDKSLSSLWQA